MHRKQPTDSRSNDVSRRAFLGTTLTGSAALLTGGLASLATSRSSAANASNPPWLEATIPQLQSLFQSGQLSSRELTLGYLARIRQLNPLLSAVIETNPQAVAIAAQLDNERRHGHVRGPLHGIPVLVKDNIATDDNMQSTAGSLALVNSRVPADALIVARLRAAGAVILGKANLSEWANFRGFAPFNGWSARGGFTRDPYLLDFDPCGSSSGSAVSAAMNLCAATVGTETDGSVVCPSGNNLVVGLKPTVGLISQNGIIPIAHSQDTAGPICRTVTDVAIMLNVLRSPFGPVIGHDLPPDYTAFLQPGALNGVRIGMDSRYFTADYGGEDDLVAVAQHGIDVMQNQLGAVIVPVDTGDPFANDFEFYNDETLVLLYEFKGQIAQYLSGLHHTSMRTLADLIAFDIAHCRAEMKYFGQEIFEMSEATSGNLNDPEYLAARMRNLAFARGGIDGVLQTSNVQAIVAPTYSFASSPAAVAGYPDISIPIGLTPAGKPAGLWMYSGFLSEPSLLAFAFALEQAIHPRTQPQFLGAVPPEPPDAGICSPPPQPQIFTGQAQLSRHFGTGKPFIH
jgi:amidase